MSESMAKLFLRLGHEMPYAKEVRLSSKDVDAWKCLRCDTVLRVGVHGSWLSPEQPCRGRK